MVENSYVPVSFITKRIDKHPVVPGVNSFPVNYLLSGINSVRYILLVFQVRDLAVYPTVQVFNNSLFNHPYNSRANMIDISNINARVGGTAFYVSNYNNNDLSTNKGSSFYNEFKKLRQDYLNDYRDTDMITYDEFINLYRIYCINVTCQDPVPSGTNGNIEIQLTFNSQVPNTDVAEINLYSITYSDSDWSFKYDGQRQICSQVPMK